MNSDVSETVCQAGRNVAPARVGGDIGIGVDILTRAALADEFAGASGQYFDNDKGQFASSDSDALNEAKSNEVVSAIETVLARLT